MAWIETISEQDADGDLKTQYDAARKRAGKIFNIVSLSSLNPAVNRSFMELYLRIMYGPSELSRATRELLATVTSRANACHY